MKNRKKNALYFLISRFHFGKDLQNLLADRLLTERRGHRLPKEIKRPELEYHEHETGPVELHEDVIKALERKHRAEMEMMVHMLQGKEASQTRANVKKLTNGKIYKICVNLILRAETLIIGTNIHYHVKN